MILPAHPFFSGDILNNRDLKRAIKDKDGDAVYAIISPLDSYQQLRAIAAEAGYRSITLGGGPELEVGVGATTEYVMALDWQGRSHSYGSRVTSKGASISAGLGLSVGLGKIGSRAMPPISAVTPEEPVSASR